MSQIEVEMLKPWSWRGGWLQKGKRYKLPPLQAQELVDRQVAARVEESTMLEPATRQAVKRKVKGRRRATTRQPKT